MSNLPKIRTAARFSGLVLLFLAAACAAATMAPLATKNGAVQGLMQDGVAVFRGLPYAASPEGDLRWRAPQPTPQRSATFDATVFGPVCPQSQRGSAYLKGLPMSEDCLRLNVYAPAAAFAGGARVPVMLWIHGGSYRWGAGSWPGNEPLVLAKQGVAVVTINYRLGRLGLFAHPALSASMPSEPIANFALMDQIAALRWVRDNIAAFGGDPARVTIFGQSAGGVSVTALMATPEASGLFSGAIAQSGASRIEGDRQLRGTDGPIESLESDGLRMAKSFGIADDVAAPAKLHALPVADLLAYSDKEMPNSMNPVVDGRLMPTDVSRIFRAGRQQAVPFMSGTVDREESLLGSYPFKLEDMMRGEDPAPVRAVYADLDEPARVKAWFADSLFRGPARFLAGEMPRVGKPAWFYEFSYVGETLRRTEPGAAHSDDVAFTFGDLGLRGRWRSEAPPTDADRRMASTVMDYWVNFAKHGNPNGPGLPNWPSYLRSTDQLLELGATISPHKPGREAALRFLDRGYEAALSTPNK